MPGHSIGSESSTAQACSQETKGVLAISSPFFGFVCLVLIGVGGIGAACKKKQNADVVGFGLYEIGKSTPKVGTICRPEGEQTYCSNNPSPTIAGHKTQTDLYFQGHGDDAPLVEILVGLWDCRHKDLQVELEGRMGKPDRVGTKRAMWLMDKMTVVAQLPRNDQLCTIHFLDPLQEARRDELFAEAQPESGEP